LSRYGVLCPRDCTVPAPCYAAQDYSILRSCSFQISRSTWRRARVVVYPHRKCAASEHVTPLGTSAERHVLAGCTCRNATAPPAHAVPSCPRIAHSRIPWEVGISGLLGTLSRCRWASWLLSTFFLRNSGPCTYEQQEEAFFLCSAGPC
jgi:hypothetical protein